MVPASNRNSSQIGHWLFFLTLTKSGKHQTWTCQCTLCGHKVHCVDFTGRVLPLTGSLYHQRRKHDKRGHPDKLFDQKLAENAILARA